jgi:hypothetical protein
LNGPSIIVSAFVLAAGFLVLYGLAIIIENLTMSLRGVRVDGRVTHWSKVEESLSGTSEGETPTFLYYPTVQFEAEGKSFRFESETGFAKKQWALGSAIPVLYRKARPEQAQVVTGRWGRAVFCIVFGLVLFGILLFLKFSA